MRLNQKRVTAGEKIAGFGKVALAWIIVVGALALLFLQVRALILYLAILVIENESLRPTGWSQATLVGLNRCTTSAGAMLWFMMIMYAGNKLWDMLDEARFWFRVGRATAIMVGIYAVATLIMYVVG